MARTSTRFSCIALALGITAASMATIVPSLGQVEVAEATVTTCGAAGLSVTELHGPVLYVEDDFTPFPSQYIGYRVTNGTGGALSGLRLRLTTFSAGLQLGTYAPASVPIGALGVSATKNVYQFVSMTGSEAPVGAQSFVAEFWEGDPTLPGSQIVCSYTDDFASVSDTIAAAANKVTGVSFSTASPTLGTAFTVTVTGETGTIGAGEDSDPNVFLTSPSVLDAWPASAFRLEGVVVNFVASGKSSSHYLRVSVDGTDQGDYSVVYTLRMISAPPQRF